MKVHIGIPVVIVLLVVAYFVYKNKDKITAKFQTA